MRDRPHGGHRSRGRGACAWRSRASSLVCDRQHGDLGSGRPKGAARCPIESRQRGAVKSGCHAGFDACSGDRTLLETRRKPPTRSGELNLGGRSPRTRIGRPWACCLSCTARVGGSAASSSSANRMPASPARYGAVPTPPRKRSCFARDPGARPARTDGGMAVGACSTVSRASGPDSRSRGPSAREGRHPGSPTTILGWCLGRWLTGRTRTAWLGGGHAHPAAATASASLQ
jgi:hypothetical protein